MTRNLIHNSSRDGREWEEEEEEAEELEGEESVFFSRWRAADLAISVCIGAW